MDLLRENGQIEWAAEFLEETNNFLVACAVCKRVKYITKRNMSISRLARNVARNHWGKGKSLQLEKAYKVSGAAGPVNNEVSIARSTQRHNGPGADSSKTPQPEHVKCLEANTGMEMGPRVNICYKEVMAGVPQKRSYHSTCGELESHPCKNASRAFSRVKTALCSTMLQAPTFSQVR
ncbi:hypothetical protein AKJ16_DCAP17889 [Drosera capensis]